MGNPTTDEAAPPAPAIRDDAVGAGSRPTYVDLTGAEPRQTDAAGNTLIGGVTYQPASAAEEAAGQQWEARRRALDTLDYVGSTGRAPTDERLGEMKWLRDHPNAPAGAAPPPGGVEPDRNAPAAPGSVGYVGPTGPAQPKGAPPSAGGGAGVGVGVGGPGIPPAGPDPMEQAQRLRIDSISDINLSPGEYASKLQTAILKGELDPRAAQAMAQEFKQFRKSSMGLGLQIQASQQEGQIKQAQSEIDQSAADIDTAQRGSALAKAQSDAAYAADQQAEIGRRAHQQVLQDHEAKMAAAAQDIAQYKDDPQKAWAGTSGGISAAFGVLGLLAGSISQGFKGGDNPAMPIIDKIMQRSIDSQRAGLNAKKSALDQQNTVYGMMRARFGDDNAAAMASKATMLGQYASAARQMAQEADTDRARRNLSLAADQLDRSSNEADLSWKQMVQDAADARAEQQRQAAMAAYAAQQQAAQAAALEPGPDDPVWVEAGEMEKRLAVSPDSHFESLGGYAKNKEIAAEVVKDNADIDIAIQDVQALKDEALTPNSSWDSKARARAQTTKALVMRALMKGVQGGEGGAARGMSESLDEALPTGTDRDITDIDRGKASARLDAAIDALRVAKQQNLNKVEIYPTITRVTRNGTRYRALDPRSVSPDGSIRAVPAAPGKKSEGIFVAGEGTREPNYRPKTQAPKPVAGPGDAKPEPKEKNPVAVPLTRNPNLGTHEYDQRRSPAADLGTMIGNILRR